MSSGQRPEDLEYYRERSRAPGVREGGAERNHYCLSCNGVIRLHYDSRKPPEGELETCPHCGVELDARVRAMFNWVEIDQVPGSDFRALLPWMAGGGLLILAAVVGLVLWLS